MNTTSDSHQRRNPWWRLVRFGFRLLYNEIAWSYDWVSQAVSLGHWRKWQKAALAHVAGHEEAQLLELAHGTANLLSDMQTIGWHPIGLDLSPHMGRIARRKLMRKGHTPELVRGMAQKLPFPDRCFDSIVSTFPTAFIIQPDTLDEAYRVLKPGGRLVVIPNGQLDITNLLARIMEWLYTVTGQRGPWPVAIEQVFAEANFKVQVVEERLPGSKVWIVIAEK